MSNVSSVNLSALSKLPSYSANALLNLALFANGPLRLQKKVESATTVTYLGVRSWSTYFFEKIIATPAQVAKAELKTQAAIDQHVRSFMNNSGLTTKYDGETVVASLQSKTVGKSVLPVPVAAVGKNGKSGTRPNYKKCEVVEAKGKLLRGTGTVPTGLSVAAVSPLRIIADVRLVTEATFELHPLGDARRGTTCSLGEFPAVGKKVGVNDFKKYYLGKLNDVAAFINTSAVMELERDNGKCCSAANLEGARAAATEFRGMQKLQHGKHVSIMLTVPQLPSKQDDTVSTAKTIDTRATSKPNNTNVDELVSETSEDELSD